MKAHRPRPLPMLNECQHVCRLCEYTNFACYSRVVLICAHFASCVWVLGLNASLAQAKFSTVSVLFELHCECVQFGTEMSVCVQSYS
jgi:hypothetical protein